MQDALNTGKTNFDFSTLKELIGALESPTEESKKDEKEAEERSMNEALCEQDYENGMEVPNDDELKVQGKEVEKRVN